MKIVNIGKDKIKRRLAHVLSENLVSEIAGTKIYVKRDPNFQGLIGFTKRGGEVWQKENIVYLFDPPAPRIPFPFKNVEVVYSKGSTYVYSVVNVVNGKFPHDI